MKNLKEFRKKRGFTQKHMAEILHVNVSTYSRYERGVLQPGLDTLVKISEYLNVSTDYLLGLIDSPFTPDEAAFMRKIYAEKDPTKIAEDFEVYSEDPDKPVSRKELNEIIKKIKELDAVVNGNFFKKKDH